MNNAIVETEVVTPLVEIDWQNYQPRRPRQSVSSELVPRSYIRSLECPTEEGAFPFAYAFHLLDDVRGKTVVSLGCGDGVHVIALASLGAQVTAIDVSANKLRRTRERAAAHGIEGRIALIHSDATKIPIQDGIVDRVLCGTPLPSGDFICIGRQIRRILKPGGASVFVQPIRGSTWFGTVRRYLLRNQSWIKRHSPLMVEQAHSVSRAVGCDGRRREFTRPFGSVLVWEARKEK